MEPSRQRASLAEDAQLANTVLAPADLASESSRALACLTTANAGCGGSGSKGPATPFRTLVVVPRSHADGTFERLCGRGGATGKVQCRDWNLTQRAVQLDLRPDAERRHRSLFVAWDSRLVHQGHTHGADTYGFNPPLHRPPIFSSGEDSAWRGHLEAEGYAAVADVLDDEEVDEALGLLLRDLQQLCPAGRLQSLGEVRECHLPLTSAANDLRAGGGLCHGDFAWFLRGRPQVARIFEQLFDVPPGAPLTGSVDVLALAPPGSSARFRGKQWLHLDYTPPHGRIWQACVQLFPRGEAAGERWERIALMVCKAPVQWTTRRAEHALLACCVAGAASRATAGVTLGKMHAEGREQPRAGARRLLPALAGAPLAGAEVARASATADAGACGVAQQLEPAELRWLAPQELMRRFSAADLRKLLPAAVLQHVSPRPALVGATAPCRPGQGVAPELPRAPPRAACGLLEFLGRRRGQRRDELVLDTRQTTCDVSATIFTAPATIVVEGAVQLEPLLPRPRRGPEQFEPLLPRPRRGPGQPRKAGTADAGAAGETAAAAGRAGLKRRASRPPEPEPPEAPLTPAAVAAAARAAARKSSRVGYTLDVPRLATFGIALASAPKPPKGARSPRPTVPTIVSPHRNLDALCALALSREGLVLS